MKQRSNLLYWKISGALMALLAVLGIGYVLITGYVGGRYMQEVNQRLYGYLADSTVAVLKPLVDGKVDTVAIQDIMHSMMVMNSSVEVYLLDTTGHIITYVAPKKIVLLEEVNLAPVKTFISSEEKPFIKGDDPRHPDRPNVFSAAPIVHNGQLEGYLYIILAGDEQTAVTSALTSSYMLRLGTNMFFVTLVVALLIGLLAIWLLTKNLRQIIDTVRRFKEGDYNARIEGPAKGDLKPLADTFNEMADQIVSNIEQLQSVERLRRELIANVSHDLRTPLAIMQGYVETLMIKDKDLTEGERQQYLQTVLSSSEKLSKLVSQLFEFSKLEANQVEPQKEPFFLPELAQDLLANYEILAQKQGVTLHLDASRELPPVFADIALVERVLQNLIDNALKFTPEGGTVTLTIREDEKDIMVRVSDTGPGIPEKQQTYIFERYRQAPEAETKSVGAGLGLAIVKKILEIHNSTIQVQSRPNQGAAFWFELPVYQGV